MTIHRLGRTGRPLLTIATLAAAGLAALPLPASAAGSHKVKITIRETSIYGTDGPDPHGPPSYAAEAGLFTGTLGSGVNRTDVHVLAGKGTRVMYTRRGTLHGSFVFGGSRKGSRTSIIGTFTIAGGTGRYAGARGKLHIDGYHDDATGISTEHLSGTLRY